MSDNRNYPLSAVKNMTLITEIVLLPPSLRAFQKLFLTHKIYLHNGQWRNKLSKWSSLPNIIVIIVKHLMFSDNENINLMTQRSVVFCTVCLSG